MILDAENTTNLVIPPIEWQREGWLFYKAIGELRFAIGIWLANCLSRCRLVAAVKNVGEDNPSPVTEGPVADLVAQLGGGIGGQAAMLKRQGVQISVAGDSYMVGEDVIGTGNLEDMTWTVYSSDEIRIKSRGRSNSVLSGEVGVQYEVNTYRNEWRTLSPESMVIRCWDPDEQFSWAATSVVQSALPICREIDLYNRYIIAILTSRLASNGVWLLPQEVTFPVKPQFKDQPDPFVAEIIDIASRGIKNPGSASSAMPIPIKVPAAYIEMMSKGHLTFASELSDKIMEHRLSALRRLATTVNVPAEVLTGMDKINHWGQWQLEESAIKIYISPIMELLVNCYTQGYLYPLMKAMGLSTQAPDGGTYMIWYDTSELSQQPDRGADAQAAYDRGELSAEALRRENGFEEEDAPTVDEFKDIALRKIAMGGGADAMTALAKLTGDDSLLPPEPTPADQGNQTDQPGSNEDQGGDQQPPAVDQAPGRKGPPQTQPAVIISPQTAGEYRISDVSLQRDSVGV
jgi:hypothetical protein